MSDPDLRHTYATYRDQLALRQKHNKYTYVVYPVASSEAYTLHKAIWKTRGAKFLPLTADEFFLMLNEGVRRAHAQQGIADLTELFGWPPAELTVRVEKIKDALGLQDDEDAYRLLRNLGGLGIAARS